MLRSYAQCYRPAAYEDTKFLPILVAPTLKNMKVFYFLFLPFLMCVTVMLVDLNEHGQATAWTMIAFLFTLFCLAVAIVIACRNWAKQSKARQNRTIL